MNEEIKVFIKDEHNGVKSYQIWEKVRPICTAICGVSYVRQIDPADADDSMDASAETIQRR